MSGSSEGWDTFDAAMRAYVSEFATLSASVDPELSRIPQWVQRGATYVREIRPTYFMAQSVANQAFYLKSFPALEAAFYESPLKPYLPGGSPSAPGPQTYIHPRDVAIRAAFRAINVYPDQTQAFDRDSIEADLRSLHNLVESKMLRMELIGIVTGMQVTETVALRENLRIESLTPAEVGTFFNPAPFPITINNSTGEQEALLPAPIAALRLSFDQPRDEVTANHVPELLDEFERLANSVALHHDVRPALFLWRQWSTDEFLRGGYSTSAPIGIGLAEKSEVIADATRVLEAYSALRKLFLSGKEAHIPLAIRRIGLTRIRASSEDVLIDTMIALEALLLADNKKERGELALRMSLRAAQWAATLGESAGEAFDLVRRTYGIRSRVVHGGMPKKDAMFDVDGIKASYDDIVARLACLSRKLGIDALRKVLNDDVDMEWDSRLKGLLQGTSERLADGTQ